MGDLLNTLEENWAVIVDAPLAFAIWTVVLFASCWAIVSHFKANQIGDLKSRLELGNDRIADYERRLAGASPQEAEQQIVTLKQEISALKPLDLSGDQTRALRTALQKAPNRVVIFVDNSTRLSRQLAAGLARVFAEAGWQVSITDVMLPQTASPHGIAVSREAPSDARSVIVEALAAAGLDYSLEAPVITQPVAQLLISDPQ